jgi:hypothetical protein
VTKVARIPSIKTTDISITPKIVKKIQQHDYFCSIPVINGWNSGKQNEDNLNKDLVKVYLRFVSNPLWQWRPSKHALLVEKHGQNTCTIENKTSSIGGFMVIQKEREKKNHQYLSQHLKSSQQSSQQQQQQLFMKIALTTRDCRIFH